MNWKNITIETGFIKQEINLNGSRVVNYIPINQIDSFGVVNTENKKWLYAGFFFTFCTVAMAFSNSGEPKMILAIISAALFAIYYFTRQTWFMITSNQTKFSVKVMTSEDEIQAVNTVILTIKENIKDSQIRIDKKAA